MSEEWKPSISPNSRHPDEYSVLENNTKPGEETARRKRTRLRQACDACRLRKVKCDEGGPPCRACAAQGLLCAYTRMRKKPGPPIRRALPRVSSATEYQTSTHHHHHHHPNHHNPSHHAVDNRYSDEAIHRMVNSAGSSSTSVSPIMHSLRNASFSTNYSQNASPISPLNLRTDESPGKLMSRPISLPQLEYQTDYLLPTDAMELLLDDYFTYIYPLIPLPHEASFWEDYRRDRAKVDTEFLSLIYCMCCATIVSFPRKVQSYCNHYYPTAISMLERAHALAITTRPIDYRDRLNGTIAASIYLLALATSYANMKPKCVQYVHEMFFVAKLMLFGQGPSLIPADELRKDLVEYEMRKRMFWLTFTGERSIYSLIGPTAPTFILDYRPEEIVALQLSRFPKELDDDFITQSSYHEDETPYHCSVITGLNANSKLFMIYARYLASTERDKSASWIMLEPELKFRILKSYITEIRTALDWLPRELKLDLRLDLGETSSPSKVAVPGPGTAGDPYSNMMDYMELCPPEPPTPANVILVSTPMSNASQDPTIERRRKQFEVQKANLYISQLHLHSVLVSHYSRIARSHRSSIELLGVTSDGWESEVEVDVHAEMEYICRAMLAVAHRVGFEHMQPNGQSLILKIRGIAAGLLEEVRAEGPVGKSAGQAAFQDDSVQARIHEYLVAFLGLLTKLAGENDAADRGWLKGLRSEDKKLQEDV